MLLRLALKYFPVFLIATSLSAQQANRSLKELSLEELSQIDVTTPSKAPESAFRSPVAIFVITADDIRRAGATSIPDALRLAPGVEVARIDTGRWSVGIRGFGTQLARSVLVLIDGRSVYTPLFAGTYWDVQDTMLEDIERIEVIRGPGGTIWGPNAVNGVINIITKSAADTHGVIASAGGGNLEQGFARMRYGGGNGKGLDYRFYVKSFTRGPEYHFNDDNFDDSREIQSGFRIDWRKSATASFTLSGDIYAQEKGEQVQLGNYTPPMQRTFTGNADLSGGNLIARWSDKLSARHDLEVQAYYDRTNRHEPNLGELRDTFDVDVVDRFALNTRQVFTFGAGARFSEGRFLEVQSGLVFSPANNLDYLISTFFQDDLQVVPDKLELSLGTKLLKTNFTGAIFQPSVRLSWTPNESHTLWAAFTRAVRAPSRAEHDFYLSSYLGTGGNGLPTYARFNANPDFAPEQLNGFEIGYRTLVAKSFFVDISTFWNHYHDLFSQDLVSLSGQESTLPFPEPVPPPTHNIITAKFGNDLYGFTTGQEIAPEWRPTAYWRLRASYSFLNMNLSKAPGTALGGAPPSVVGTSPRHQAVVQSGWDIGKKLQADLIYRYVSAVPAVAGPAYSTGDARIAWRITPNVEFALVGRDLLQPHHVEYVADPGGPVAVRRSAFLTLTWTK